MTGDEADDTSSKPDEAGDDEPGDAPARVVLSWSGGKDASLALADLRARDDAEVAELLTTVSADTGRVTMHGVRRGLVEHQADAVGVPVRVVELPQDPSNDEYEATMDEVHADYAARGFDRVAFADLLLEDVRAYREEQLADAALDGWWPVWGRDTSAVARDFLDRGFRATVACVDGDHLDAAFAGRDYDDQFLRDLPDDVDPCGENGEFHTFVWDGPVFSEPVSVDVGEVVTRDVKGSAFHYADLLPA